MYDICTEYTEIIAGTNNRCANSYMEAAKNITASNEKGMKYVENFINSIEQINKKAGNDSRISSSKGNIKSFQGYENITTAIEFVTKNASGTEGVKDLATIKNMLEKFQPLYTESYEKQVRLIMLEYETALYMLIIWFPMVLFICGKILFCKKDMNWGKTAHGLVVEEQNRQELEMQEV